MPSQCEHDSNSHKSLLVGHKPGRGFPDIITKAAIEANVNCVQLFGNSMSVPMIGLMICLAWSGYREF